MLIREVDDAQPEATRDLATCDLPATAVASLQPETALDQLEATTHAVGPAILRRTLAAQWDWWMRPWPSRSARAFSPQPPSADGHAVVQVASRFGRLALRRQVFAPVAEQPHGMPGNAVLPAHHGMLITRGLQELACLWPQDLPFAPVARLLGWQAQTEAVRSDTSIRTLVRTHGQLLRHAAQDELRALLAHPERSTLQPQLVPTTQPRRRAGWPPELRAAVDQARQDGLVDPPTGVSRANWERGLDARRQEAALPLETRRQLGPQVQPEQPLVNTDEVVTRARGTRRFWERRTARVSPPTSTR